MTLIFVIIAIVLGLLDAYILVGVIHASPLWAKLVLLLPSVVYVGLILKIALGSDMRQGTLNLLFWLTLCVVLTTFIFAVFSLIGKGIGLVWAPGFRIFNIIGVMAACLWLGMSLYGIVFGWKKVTVEKVTIASPKVPPTFRGYRIVQLSDFHIGTYHDSPSTVEKIVKTVNSLNPDLVVFTGDLVNSHSEEIKEFEGILSQIKAKDGVYSVLGNHDYCLYRDYTAPDSPAKELARVTDTEKRIGWRMLRNESVTIKRGSDSIAIVGVDNAGSRMFPDKSDLKKAINGLPDTQFKILLSHDPSHWRREVLPSSDVDLTLSGHTHAMQFKLGNWSPSVWTYPEWGGLYVEHGRQLYVSTGIGENIAFRFGAWPQIVCITLDN